MKIGSNNTHTKAYNYRLVLETIRLEGPVSRAIIAKKTELTAQTVTNIVRWLLREKLVREAERSQEGRGAPSTLLVIRQDGAFSIGLDLDRDHLTGILIDLNGDVRRRQTYFCSYPSPEESMDLMESCARSLVLEEKLDLKNIWGVGIGLPGPFEIANGRITSSVDSEAIAGWSHIPIMRRMSERLSLPIYLENNATAAAIGERRYGNARTTDTFFYLFFGLGLGGGLILDGHPYSGVKGNAGEVGFIPTHLDRKFPLPFTKPHLGIHFNLHLLFEKLSSKDEKVHSPSQLADLLTQNNPVLLEWLDVGAELLSTLILSIQYILDPEAIFFGGSVPASVLQELLSRIDHLLPEKRIVNTGPPTLLRLASAGADAAALGVATIPLFESFDPSYKILARRISKNVTAPFAPLTHSAKNT